MEYENIDENAKYLKACENVKKIVNAIKIIKMKYYTNFARISEEDQKMYEELEENLEKISEENNLENLKAALMEEVSAKYDKKDLKNEPENHNSVDNRLLACYGNVDVQQRALSMGKIGQARKCQQILQQYLEEIDIEEYKEIVNNYKREKFAELVMERVAIQEKNDEYMNYMKDFFCAGTTERRKQATQKIEEEKMNMATLFDTKEISELEPQIG